MRSMKMVTAVAAVMASGMAPAQVAALATAPEAAPEAWLQEDPASRTYQAAREALSRRRYRDAAEQFEEIRDRYPRSGYVPDSYYWQAFSLYREGSRRNLRDAIDLLEVQASEHDDASTRSDADELMVRRHRIERELPGQKGVADHPDAVDIGPSLHLTHVRDLLRRQIRDQIRVGAQIRFALRETEVGDDRSAIGQDVDVVRAQMSVDERVVVRNGEGGQETGKDPRSVTAGMRERGRFEMLDGHVRRSVQPARFVARRDPDVLRHFARTRDAVPRKRAEDDVSLHPLVVGEVDRSAAPLRDERLDAKPTQKSYFSTSLRKVVRWIPSCLAACTWLPPVLPNT